MVGCDAFPAGPQAVNPSNALAD
ncbi:protein of unknown function [Paraburkholderia kururiensis]